MPMRRLGVKMCGNCNPDIESMAAAKKIAAALNMELVPYDQGDVTLTISACISSCVFEKYPSPVQIQGLRVNGYECRDQNELIDRVIDFYSELEKGELK